MSRERPIEPPRAVPDAQRGKRKDLKPHQVRERADLERLKNMQGPGFLGAFFNASTNPRFIRRSYEANIVDELNDFYRQRGWRPRHRRSGATFKERLNASRGGRHMPRSGRAA